MGARSRSTERQTQSSGPRKNQCGCRAHAGGGCSACSGEPSRSSTAARQGEQLDPQTRGFMERRFDHDFSHVRVHSDSQAAQSAAGMNALAYTAGSNIVFGAGQYAPQSANGRKLLAHELTHVVQQDRHPAAQGIAAKSVSESSDASEREADSAAERIADGSEPVTVSQAPAAPVQRSLTTANKWEIGLGIAGALGIAGLIGWKTGLFDGKSEDGVPTLDDPKFKQVWDDKIREGAQFMAEMRPDMRCHFPARREHSFDKRQWNVAAARNPAGKLGTPGFTPKSSVPNETEAQARAPDSEPLESGQAGAGPSVATQNVTTYEAVENLFRRLQKWSCDCKMYSELILLYAWHKSLTPKQFNIKFAHFQLSDEGSDGIDRKTLPGGGLDNAEYVDPKAWQDAPVGTKVAWCNNSDHAEDPWTCEHAIRISKGATPDQDRYAAQGVSGPKGERQVSEYDAKSAVAAHAPDSPYRYRVTDQVLAGLRDSKNPKVDEQTIAGIATLKGRDFADGLEFRKTTPVANLDIGVRALLEELARIDPASKDALDAYIDQHITRSFAWAPK